MLPHCIFFFYGWPNLVWSWPENHTLDRPEHDGVQPCAHPQQKNSAYPWCQSPKTTSQTRPKTFLTPKSMANCPPIAAARTSRSVHNWVSRSHAVGLKEQSANTCAGSHGSSPNNAARNYMCSNGCFVMLCNHFILLCVHKLCTE